MAKETTTFEQAYSLDCSKQIEKKQGLSYLSWPFAWREFKRLYPDATYEVVKFDNLPYVVDVTTGIMVYTQVTAGGITHEMWLPVMDAANKAMKLEPYKYNVKDRYGNIQEKWVQAATMFDINKTIMRCLVKNLAMFGLGLSIYAGEDIPEDITESEAPADMSAAGAAVEARKASRKGKSEAAPEAAPAPQGTPGYQPMDMKMYKQVIMRYTTGVLAQDGRDYRTVWGEMTHAGEPEFMMFDAHVKQCQTELFGGQSM